MSCALCGKSGVALRKCTRCMSVAYCSAKCQSDDWKRIDDAAHRHVCAHIGIRLGPNKEESDADPSVDTLRAYIRRIPGVEVMGAQLAEYISDRIDEALRAMLVTVHTDAETLMRRADPLLGVEVLAKNVAEMRSIVDFARRVDGAARRRSLSDLLQVRGMMSLLYGEADDGRVLALIRQQMLRGEFIPGRTFVFVVDKWTLNFNGNNGRLVATLNAAPSAHQSDPANALAALIPNAAIVPYPESGYEAKRVQIPVGSDKTATIDLAFRNALEPFDIDGGPCVRIGVFDNDATWPPLSVDEQILPLSTAGPALLARRNGTVAGDVPYAPLFKKETAFALVGPRAGNAGAQAIQIDLRETARSIKHAVEMVMTPSVSHRMRREVQGIHIGGFVDRVGGALDQLQQMLDAQRSDSTGGIPRMLALPRITEAVYATQPLPIVNTIRTLLLDGRWRDGRTYVFRDDDTGELLGQLDTLVFAGSGLLNIFPNARVFAATDIMQLADGYQINMLMQPPNTYDTGVAIWHATPPVVRA